MSARPITAALASATSIIAATTALGQEGWTPAQKQVEILPIYRNFIASRAAASRCNGLDAASDKRFAAKLPTVSAQAAQALQARNPNASRAEIDRQMKVMDQEARETVSGEIAKNGCASPQVQWLVQLYKGQPAPR